MGVAAGAPPRGLRRARVFVSSRVRRASRDRSVVPRDLGLSLSRGRPGWRSPSVLVRAKPLRKLRAVGGGSERAGDDGLVLCAWLACRRCRRGGGGGRAACLGRAAGWPWRSRGASARLRTHYVSNLRAPQAVEEVLCATSRFMLGEVTAPKCFHLAKVFHELNASSVELLQSVFV